MKIVKIQLTVLWDAHCNWNTVCSLFVALSWFQFLLPPNYTSYDLQFHFASQCIKAGWKVFNMSAGSVKLRSSITVVFLFIAPLRRLQNDLSEIWAWTVVSDLTPLRPMHNTLDWCVKWYGSWLLHISQRCCVKSVYISLLFFLLAIWRWRLEIRGSLLINSCWLLGVKSGVQPTWPPLQNWTSQVTMASLFPTTCTRNVGCLDYVWLFFSLLF